MQILINIIITTSFYFLISIAFFLVYGIDKFFNLSYAGIIVTSIYLNYFFYDAMCFNFLYSTLFSIIISVIFNILLIKFLFIPLKNRGAQPYVLMVASLGIYIVIIGIIGLSFGYESLFLLPRINANSLVFLKGSISIIQLFTIMISVLIFCSVNFVYLKTPLGIRIRAISTNNKLAEIFGINLSRHSLIVNSCVAFIFSIIGILIGVDTGATPNIGFNLLLYGIIVMIIAGANNLFHLALASLLLATVQHLSAYYIDTKWMDAIAYIILILFLIWKPLGFSGKRLKKTEI